MQITQMSLIVKVHETGHNHDNVDFDMEYDLIWNAYKFSLGQDCRHLCISKTLCNVYNVHINHVNMCTET